MQQIPNLSPKVIFKLTEELKIRDKLEELCEKYATNQAMILLKIEKLLFHDSQKIQITQNALQRALNSYLAFKIQIIRKEI